MIDETRRTFLFERKLGREWLSFVEKLPLDQSVGLPRKSNPHALRNHLLAPQVESHSGDRSEFKKVWVYFLTVLFGENWPMAHMGFCFDTEYIPHYISWLEDDDARGKLMNTFVVPPKFHFKKHMAESVLAQRNALIHFFCPLLTGVLQ